MRMQVLSAAGVLFLVLVGCARRETVTAEQRTEYEQGAQSRLERLRAEIDSLSAKAAASGETLRVDFSMRLAELRVQRDSVEARMVELRAAGDEAWEDVKEGTERLLERIEASLADARMHIQSRADTTTGP